MKSHLLHPVSWISSKEILPETVGGSSIWFLKATVEGSAAAFRQQDIVHSHEAGLSGMLHSLQMVVNLIFVYKIDKSYKTYKQELKVNHLGRCGHLIFHLEEIFTIELKKEFTWRRFQES